MGQAQTEKATAVAELLSVLNKVCGPQGDMIALHEPAFDARDKALVTECLDEGFVSYAGRHVGEFEQALAEAGGCRHAISVVNGTASLHLLLFAAGIGHGDEVFCPSLTFVATANAILAVGAQPHFVDCQESDLCIDPQKLDAHLSRIAEIRDAQCFNRETGARIAGIVPVHIFGRLAELEQLTEIARRWHLAIFEDSTEALGAGCLCSPGSIGGVVSFNGNKIITTGGGGAILTNDDDFAARLRLLCTTSKQSHPYHFIHDEQAFNYRLPALNAALGMAQLEKLPNYLAQKRRLAAAYTSALAASQYWLASEDMADLGLPSNHWLNFILQKKADMKRLEDSLKAANIAGYQCRPVWRPMHQLDFLAACPTDDLSVTEDLAARIICLPSSPGLVPAASEERQ